MTSRILFCALAVAFGGVSTAAAQSYPARPITLVNPYAAGGPVDAVARILSAPMSKALGQPVLVDYATGANGTIGVGRVARAAPDGYTLSIGHWARDEGFARRPLRLDGRPGFELAAAGARGKDQGLRGDGEDPPVVGAGHSDGGRGRTAGVVRLGLVRHLGAQRHAA